MTPTFLLKNVYSFFILSFNLNFMYAKTIKAQGTDVPTVTINVKLLYTVFAVFPPNPIASIPPTIIAACIYKALALKPCLFFLVTTLGSIPSGIPSNICFIG